MQAIGVIRANWRDSNGKLKSINYGTGFAVSSKVIATCTHNVYSENFKDLCSEIFFIPGKQKGQVDDTVRVYRCT
jgi:V8-like Glu-specific endopeptidase